ncbi:MAG: type III-A CRISPR-associated RAMP protein Csm5 [Saprospiraceae bacterium]|nr:type III-A CRISPR-associated RAMP protein Csm5 [Saprospiraceae bacterium]
MILKLRTLTPLHVGDGSTLHAFDYTILDGRFYRCSPRFFESFLEHLGGDAGDKFVNWSSSIMDRMVKLDQDRRLDPRRGRDLNQEMSRLRKEHSLSGFAQSIQRRDVFERYLRDNAPSIPMLGEKTKQEFRGFQRGADGRAFLPGSSVKGSIRTALLYHFLENYPKPEEIKEILRENIARVRRDKEEAAMRKFRWSPARHVKDFGERLEQLAFFAEMIDSNGKRRQQEAQNDLLRCLLVADTLVPNEAMSMENIDLYLVKKGRNNTYESQQQTQAPGVETVMPGTRLDVHLDFNAELLLHLHRKAGDAGLAVGREEHFIGWRARAKTLFNLTEADFNAVPEKAKSDHPAVAAIRKKALEHILDCCRRFSDAQSVRLTAWVQNFEAHSQDRYQRSNIQQGLQSVEAARGGRLHLGFATGFEGMTVVLHLLENHKKQFADIMDLFGIGDSPSAWRNRRPGQVYLANPDRFPTSRRLATRRDAILPLGWLEQLDDSTAAVTAPVLLVSNQRIENTPASALPSAPSAPQYLRGTLKQGAEVDAELLAGGNPGRFKLFIREDFLPEVNIKYAAGFKAEDVGRVARLRVKNVSGKGEVLAAEFLKFH